MNELVKHPTALALDALAAGDRDETTEAHVRECAACAKYVAALGEEVEAFRGQADATAFATKIEARAAADRPRARGKVLYLAAPMVAAAAAVLLWVGRPATTTSPLEPPSASAHGSHFKGGIAMTAIRERNGEQEHLSGPFDVRAGDRLRVEVSIDHDEPITAGLLSSDGTWTPLLAPTALAVGTHYSELAARFDDAPVDAVLLAGAPDDVDRARATRRFDGVVSLALRSEPHE